MKAFRIPLRVVFYREDGEWIAHCLEFDLCGNGSTKGQALESLSEAINLQVQYSLEHNNPQNLFTPAPSEIQEMFFAGHPAAEGELRMKFGQVDQLVIEEPEYREYSGDLSGSDSGFVPA